MLGKKILVSILCITFLVLIIFMVQTLTAPQMISLEDVTFRAEVMEVRPFGHVNEVGRANTMLVRHLNVLHQGDAPVLYIILQNQYVIVLNAYGEYISFLDVPQGAIVDITFNGLVLATDPGFIEGATKIQIIEIP